MRYPDIDLLQHFLKHAGNSLESFRYFKTRDFSCLKNHVFTVILINDNNQPQAYGHLDAEADVVWLGIAVSESERGKGLGKQMMRKLIEIAREKRVKRIRLSVDNLNQAAVQLYLSMGFKLVEKREQLSFYEYEVE